MSVADLITHISDPSPAFRCYTSGDRAESLSLVAHLEHGLKESATTEELQQLRDWLGPHAYAFVELYSRHNGFTLYQDTKGDAEGLCLFPVREWEDHTEDMKSQFEAMGFEPDEQPAGVNDALVFGEIPRSANYFTVKTAGLDAGKIFYADHDDFSDEPFAQSLNELLARIVANPPQFLYDVGCYSRYSDGKTKSQWIPKEYVANSDD